MSPVPHTPARADAGHPRLKLKPKSPATGWVDGAWWPRSRDLPAELPALLSVLEVRLGPIRQVSFHLGEWTAAARRFRYGQHTVRLGGFRYQPVDTLGVTGSGGHRLLLLVVPPEARAAAAHDALVAAGRRGNAQDVRALLAGVAAASRTGAAAPTGGVSA